MVRQIGWEPAVYEHKAALIGAGVAEVSRSAGLLVRAMEAEYEAYRSDALVVGVDLYNIEAEACGLEVRDLGREACPDTLAPESGGWRMPEVGRDGRFAMMLEAGVAARRSLGRHTTVRMGASGPASLASRLLGLEELVIGLAGNEPEATGALDFAERVCRLWCAAIRAAGLEVVLFDSVASPPIMSPDMYRTHIVGRHAGLMRLLAETGQAERPLIQGGDTTPILPDLLATGCTQVICDFPVEAARFAAAMVDRAAGGIGVRRNVAPATLLGEPERIRDAAGMIRADLARFERPTLGTGVLPYRTNPAHVRLLRESVLLVG
jgi:uroporphyrinogen decarboxylase